MTWFRLDDSFHSHPKANLASDEAIGLWTRAASWSAGHLTDGVIPAHMLRDLRATNKKVQSLVSAGLWEPNPGPAGGYRFRHWLEYQPSREAIEDRREKWSKERQVRRANAQCPPRTPTVLRAVSAPDKDAI